MINMLLYMISISIIIVIITYIYIYTCMLAILFPIHGSELTYCDILTNNNHPIYKASMDT